MLRSDIVEIGRLSSHSILTLRSDVLFLAGLYCTRRVIIHCFNSLLYGKTVLLLTFPNGVLRFPCICQIYRWK